MSPASALVAILAALYSVIVPTKLRFVAAQPVTVNVQSKEPASLTLTKFDGTEVGTIDVADSSKPVDVRNAFPAINNAGAYVLFAEPKGKKPADFVGTPVVILTQPSKESSDQTPVIRLMPLQYVVMTTDQGPMTMAFYYDVAPNTAENFLKLSAEGYYDGLTFHRIIPGFVIQGGDPKGDGTGGPGFTVDAEFNARPHLPGVLSMARQSDGNSDPNQDTRANTAGSQFFVCLDYKSTQQLDRKYTAFGKVTEGMDAVTKIAATPIADQRAGRPATPPKILKAEVFSVTPGHNPYAALEVAK